MKKFLYSGMALTAMLSLASCSSDDVASDLAGDGVTVTLRLPSGLESKATFGDQTTVTLDELKYTVFEKDGETLTKAFSSPGRTAFGEGKYTETETIKLGKGKDYTIVFYADQADNGFVTFTDGNISVNYEGLSSNTEDYDAFYAVVEVPSGTATVTATLTRPFSQLNWGTDDLAEPAVTAKLDGLTATVKVSNGLYTGMNLLTGEVTGDAVADAVTFTATTVAAPTDTETPNFPVTGYDLLAMNYLLTGEGTIDCELEFSNGFSPVTVSAAPVNTNYRTNIYGSLLTNPVNFNIKVDKDFNEPDFQVWDGKSAVSPVIDETKKTAGINDPSQLLGFLQMVNGTNGNTPNDFDGYTVVLAADIDLDGKLTTSVGTSTHKFKGVFDGKGHTVKGLKKSVLGYVENASVKNLTIETTSTDGGLIANAYGTVNVSEVTVNGSVKGYGVAPIVKYVQENATINITKSTNNADITDNGYCAGGFVARTWPGSTVTITDSHNYGNITSTRYSQGKAAGFVGMPAAPVNLENCVNHGNISVTTRTGGAAGGMIGWENGEFSLKNCTNNGEISLTVSNIKEICVAGGMYGGSGWGTGPKTITGCVNNGAVTVTGKSLAVSTAEYQYGLYAGGIIGGSSYDAEVITGNTNNAPITAITEGDVKQKQYVGGIVGGYGWLTDLTITGNTITANSVLSGNQNENTLINALYNLCGDAPKNLTNTPNTVVFH